MSFVRAASTAIVATLVSFSGTPAQEASPCAAPDREPDAAALTGTVRDRSGRVALPGVDVTARWDGGGRAEASSDPQGRYELCRLPAGRPLVVVARFSGFTSEAVEVRLEPGSLAQRDLEIALSRGPPDTAERGRLIGSVVDAETSRPIEAAVVGLVGRPSRAVTDSAGRFVVEGVSAGSHELEVRHLAYGAQRAPVEARGGAAVVLEIRLGARPIEVEPIEVTVTGTRDLGLEIRGFYERREWGEKLGLGHFFTAADIERRRPRYISHMIADLPGTRLDCNGWRCEIYFFADPPACERANVYLDGVRVAKSDNQRLVPPYIDELVLPAEIAGVEVYRGGASMPAEFGGSTGQCGAIVIWTR